MGRPKGSKNRPRSWLDEPDRLAIGIAEGRVLAGQSERQAYDLAAVIAPRRPRRPKGRQPAVENMPIPPELQARADQLGMVPMRRRLDSAGVSGRAAALRQKARRQTDPVALRWIAAMRVAFAMAFAGRPRPETELALRELAEVAGEPFLAETVLIPLLRAKTPPE